MSEAIGADLDWVDDLDPEEEDTEWEPKPHERVYYRHARTGDLGYMVRRDGQDMIRLDRPMEDRTAPFRESEWKQEHEMRPLTVAQAAQVAYAADQQLCRWLGLHQQVGDEWISLPESERLKWMRKAPVEEHERRRLYVAIMSALKQYCG